MEGTVERTQVVIHAEGEPHPAQGLLRRLPARRLRSQTHTPATQPRAYRYRLSGYVQQPFERPAATSQYAIHAGTRHAVRTDRDDVDLDHHGVRSSAGYPDGHRHRGSYRPRRDQRLSRWTSTRNEREAAMSTPCRRAIRRLRRRAADRAASGRRSTLISTNAATPSAKPPPAAATVAGSDARRATTGRASRASAGKGSGRASATCSPSAGTSSPSMGSSANPSPRSDTNERV